METISRTVRFKEHELKLIDEFLKRNPFFDFSTLTRVAITEFIQNPNLKMEPVDVPRPQTFNGTERTQ